MTRFVVRNGHRKDMCRWMRLDDVLIVYCHGRFNCSSCMLMSSLYKENHQLWFWVEWQYVSHLLSDPQLLTEWHNPCIDPMTIFAREVGSDHHMATWTKVMSVSRYMHEFEHVSRMLIMVNHDATWPHTLSGRYWKGKLGTILSLSSNAFELVAKLVWVSFEPRVGPFRASSHPWIDRSPYPNTHTHKARAGMHILSKAFVSMTSPKFTCKYWGR